MRIFGSERMDAMLQRLGLKEGEAIIHPWVNKALAKAQQKVEARNYDIRKQLLKYDDVMNDQRKVVYEQRREIMNARDVAADDRRHAPRDDRPQMVAAAIPENSLPEQWDIAGAARRMPAAPRPRPAGRRMGQGGRHRRRRDARSASPPPPTARWPKRPPITAPT